MEKTVRTLSEAATVAKRIKTELKTLFPLIKFSVTSERSTANIGYTDSVPSDTLDSYFAKYEDGHFDGMTDSYQYKESTHEVLENGKIEETPRVKYLFFHRNVSDQVKAVAKEYILSRYDNKDLDEYKISQGIHRLTFGMDLTKGFDKVYADNYPSGLFN